MNNNRFEVKSLHKLYKNGTSQLEVLRGIDLLVEKNEFLAIQGPSGAGKSTLLHILGGLDSPSQGEVLFEGVDVYKLNENDRADLRNKKIGFVFQFYYLLPELNVIENIALPNLLRNWWEKRKIYQEASLLLEALGLSLRGQHLPNQLSGGEQQRVALARALINRPDVLLCDEPTGNLDSENGLIVLNLLKKLNKEKKMTVVLVTHNGDIAASADRIIYLKDGIILN